MFANRYIGGVKVPCIALYVVAILFIIVYGYYIRHAKDRTCSRRSLLNARASKGVTAGGTPLLLIRPHGIPLPRALYPGIRCRSRLGGRRDYLGTHKLEVSGKRLKLIGDTDEDGDPTGNDDIWWFGRISDVCFDIGGYTVGTALAEKYWPNDYVRTPISPSLRAQPRLRR